MKENSNNVEDILMPKWLSQFFFIGIGTMGLHLSFNNIDIENIGWDMAGVLIIAGLFTFFIAFGVINFIRDIKEGGWEGGWKIIINKFKEFFNDI
tara:strand:- start:97 stop:381 length:285 start_codon:yes stop_codon:yes gene_type:complete